MGGNKRNIGQWKALGLCILIVVNTRLEVIRKKELAQHSKISSYRGASQVKRGSQWLQIFLSRRCRLQEALQKSSAGRQCCMRYVHVRVLDQCTCACPVFVPIVCCMCAHVRV